MRPCPWLQCQELTAAGDPADAEKEDGQGRTAASGSAGENQMFQNV